MSPRLCAIKPLFHRHFRDLLRNHVASRRLFAQTSRPTTSFCTNKSTYDVVEFSDKRGSKCPKKPPNSPFLLGIAERSDLRGGSMSPCLFLQQNRARFGHLNFLHLARFLRCQRGLAYLAVLLLKSPHRAFLGLTRGYLRQKKRRIRRCPFSSKNLLTTSQQPR